eukprot:s953_g8.t2
MPKGSYRDPSKPYRHCKLNDLTDEQAKADNMIGLVRARARGIIMDMHGAYRDVTEVRIILGPKFDMMISLDDDDDEGMTFKQEMIEHMPMKMVKSKSNMMCITLPILAKDRRFILDSGSGHNLISEKAERMGLRTSTCEPITFHTANGSTSTNQQARIDIGTFDKAANAYILDDTPSVMSLGKRCMDEGYSFLWPSKQMPFLINKDGKRIDLSLHDNIPYVDLGGDVLPLRGDAFTRRIHELLLGKDMESSTSHTVFIDGSSGDEIENTQDTCDGKKKVKRKKKNSRTRSVKSVPADDVDDDDGELSYAPGTPYDGPAPDTDDEGEVPLPAPDAPPEPDPHPEGHGRVEERRDEDDEDDIEIDVVEGESRVAKRGTLKREAKSIEHKLTHKYKNPYCDSCVRAKMKHFKTRRGAYRRELKKFGDLITFDAVNTDKIHDDTLILEKEVLVVRDCFTGLIGAYPSSRMTSDDVVRAVKQFIGARKVREAYSDRAPQFDDAMFEMKIPIDHSLPGRPQTNSIAERTNQFILTTTCTCLLEAGLPPCFWRTAIQCVCHLLNTEPNDDEISAWCKLHGSEFKGKLIPYGALVNYKPPATRDVNQSHKFDPDAIPGVFAGYHVGPGMHWSRQYKDDEGEHDDDGQDDDDDDAGGGSGPSGGRISKKKSEGHPPDGKVDAGEPTLEELIAQQPDHWREGKANDGIVYLDDIGQKVKLDRRGRPYRIDESGRRYFRTSLRPKGTSPEEWAELSQVDRNVIKKVEAKKLEKKAAKEKEERILKDVKKKALAEDKKGEKKKKRKKEKKEKKKDKETESKDVGEGDPEDIFEDHLNRGPRRSKDADVGVNVKEENVKISLPLSCTSIDMDMYDIVDDDLPRGKRYIDCRRRHADVSPCSNISTDVPDDEEYLTEWDEWSEIEKGRGPKATWSGEYWDTMSGTISKFCPATPAERTIIKNGKCVPVKQHMDKDLENDDNWISFPTMPCTVNGGREHRQKIVPEGLGGLGGKMFNAMVSRPVGRAEIESNPKAKESMLKEWKGLRDQGVFDFTMVGEYDDVVAEAKREGKEIHMARVPGICVEKNFQLPDGDPGRKFKGRGVLLGNQVKNQHWEAAFFQDLGNSPASFEASRWADFYGCLPGHSVKLADAIQAYIQAKLKGPVCWVDYG